ncbi:unnamed protein product [Rotaria sordida]|uniref:B box-type domain-containing protein n=1 Tax=Rotaria sordida TaxID=392033 RepID=A0A814GQ92_9BILA|nr:unnamed protein product [Rotaria sordida]CAF4015695.1 unnamed protein product [Rotaria sordida]
MATGTSRTRCIRCHKERRGVKCDGCSQLYCYDCLPHHHQELSKELDEIETIRNLFRETLTEQTQDPNKHSLIKQINQWEEDSIKKIKQTVHECRQLLLQHIAEHITQIEGDGATCRYIGGDIGGNIDNYTTEKHRPDVDDDNDPSNDPDVSNDDDNISSSISISSIISSDIDIDDAIDIDHLCLCEMH